MKFIRHDWLIVIIVIVIGASVMVAQHWLESKNSSVTHQEQVSKMAECPICKMMIEVTETTPRYVHEGKTYYFMNEEMKQEFISNLESKANSK